MREEQRQTRRSQDGAVIVEFAAVFVVFAILLAGLITYGMIFAVQQSLEHATSEAARATVGVSNPSDAEARVTETLNGQLDWLVRDSPALDSPDLEAVVCPMAGTGVCDGVAEGSLSVQVTYRGGLVSLMPFQIATPSQLTASATLTHDLEDEA